MRSRFEGKIGPADTLGKADGLKRVCARNDDKVWITSRLKGVAYLSKPRFELNCMLLARMVVKPFRINLVFQVNACGPRFFKQVDHVYDVSRLAESSPNINHDGYIHCIGDGPSDFHHICQGEIRFHHTRRVPERTAGEVESTKSNLLCSPSGNDVVDAGCSDNSRLVYHFAQNGGHPFRSLSRVPLRLSKTRNRACSQTTQSSDGHTFPKISS